MNKGSASAGTDGRPPAGRSEPPRKDLIEKAHAKLQSASVIKDRRIGMRGDTDRRMATRLATDVSAKLSDTTKSQFDGALLNISVFGCSIEIGSNTFVEGDRVWMEMDALQQWRGTVRWIDEGKVGVMFDQPFYPTVLERLTEPEKAIVRIKAA